MTSTDHRTAAIYRAVGDLVAEARRHNGLTQEGLAEQTDGRLSRSAIANIERGRQRVAVHHVFDLAHALGVPPETLLPDARFVPPLPKQAARELRKRVTQRGGGRLLKPKRTEDGR